MNIDEVTLYLTQNGIEWEYASLSTEKANPDTIVFYLKGFWWKVDPYNYDTEPLVLICKVLEDGIEYDHNAAFDLEEFIDIISEGY